MNVIIKNSSCVLDCVHRPYNFTYFVPANKFYRFIIISPLREKMTHAFGNNIAIYKDPN